MLKVTVNQVAGATWAASTVVSTALERVGVITRIDMTNEIVPSATLTASNVADGLFRPINNMRIVGSQQVYFTLPADSSGPGGTLLHYLNRMDGMGVGHSDGAITAPQRTVTSVNYVYHCGSRPRSPSGYDNPFDMTAFIPASIEGQLNAEWTTTANSVMDATVTISSAVMRFIISRILGEEDELKTEMVAQRVNLPPGGISCMVPAWSAVAHVNVGATTDFDAEQVDITVGGFLKRIAWLTQDAAALALRASDEVNRVAIRVPKGSQDLFQSRTEFLTMHQEYGSNLTINSGASESAGTVKFGVDFNAAAARGIQILDLRPRANWSGLNEIGQLVSKPWLADYGYDLRGAQNGDFKLGLYNDIYAAGDDTLIIFERYVPYTGHLVQTPF